MEEKATILVEYENLIKAKQAINERNKRQYDKYCKDIKDDLGKEYICNINAKIERWIGITDFLYFESSKPVEFYIQAKMLYRDGFFEAAIMMTRSICEMICYHLLKLMKHSIGSDDKIEKTNFRILVRYIYENSDYLSGDVYSAINKIYDIGNNYIHPKSKQNPKDDSCLCLGNLGGVLFEIFGVKNVSELTGKLIETAYANFPDICNWYHFGIEGFTSIEAATKDAKGED